MNIIENLTSSIEEMKKSKYSVNSISAELSKTDTMINETIEFCISIDRDEQDRIIGLLTLDMAWLLLCFGIRMATYALRLSSQSYFTNGLFAIGMTLGILDKRELLVILSLYCDAGKKRSLSFSEMINRNNEFSSLLKDFINRDESSKSLECMGYILEIDENNVPTYQRTW